ncbi:hypothetical protein AX16_007429 [Volvariella volvacea WC 439]|nr:hypothetical protein AX16_007429 [Volvariella volvacea WC 439]
MPSRLLSLCSPVPALPPAPCPFLLGCNDPPTTDEEWESIHTAIEQATDVLKALDDWDKTSNPPTHLSSRRDEALSFIRCHQNVVSPIRRIPPEIWSTIFYHYTTSVRKQGRRQFPLFVLALVCRKWRDIVYGMAPLWACPPSTRLFKHGLRPARAWPLFKAYVDRATGQPLTLDITSGDKESYDIERFARLVSLAEQWGDITARLTFPIFNSSVHLLEGELVNLRRLALTIVGDPSHKLPDDLFVVSDKLTDVSLWTTRVNYWPILPRNVLRFEGAFNGYQNFFRMFQHTAASLEECILVWDFGVRPDALQPTTPLVFQNLSRLTMQGYYLGFEQAADYFFSQITLPSLEHLTMDFTPLPRRFIALWDLFKRSSIDPGRGHCLHTLVLRGLWLSSQLDTGIHFSTLFRQTPNLVELHINGLDTGTWIELQIVQPRPILLPKLARLFLYWFGL